MCQHGECVNQRSQAPTTRLRLAALDSAPIFKSLVSGGAMVLVPVNSSNPGPAAPSAKIAIAALDRAGDGVAMVVSRVVCYDTAASHIAPWFGIRCAHTTILSGDRYSFLTLCAAMVH